MLNVRRLPKATGPNIKHDCATGNFMPDTKAY